MRDVSILVGQKLRAALDQRHAAPQPAHRLAQFESDVAASQDNQVFGQALQFERLDMRHWLCFAYPRYARHGCMGSDVHKYAVGSDRPFTAIAQRYVERAWCHESALTQN